MLETDVRTRACFGRALTPAVSTPQCAGIKAFVVNLVIQRSSNEELFRSDKTFMNKLNMVLVQIVKQARRLAEARRTSAPLYLASTLAVYSACARPAAPGVAACLAHVHL